LYSPSAPVKKFSGLQIEILKKLFTLKIAGFGAKRLVMVQLVCACQGCVALFPFDLHLDSARRAWGLGLYDFAPGTLAKIRRSTFG
jgi:hypothetical protein